MVFLSLIAPLGLLRIHLENSSDIGYLEILTSAKDDFGIIPTLSVLI